MTSIDLERFLAESGIDPRSLEQWIEREWIILDRAADAMELSDADAARAILIRDLRSDFGVNDEGVEIVLQLVDQVHGLRRALVSLRMEIEASREK
jgi:chaperone modulatory protein CbpM